MASVQIDPESIAPIDEEAENRVSELLAVQRYCHRFVPVQSNAQTLFCGAYLSARKRHIEAIDAAERIMLITRGRAGRESAPAFDQEKAPSPEANSGPAPSLIITQQR